MIREQQKHKPTEYMMRRSGWLRVRPKSPSKRKLRNIGRRAIRRAAENMQTGRLYKQAMAEHDERARRRKRRHDKASAEKMVAL